MENTLSDDELSDYLDFAETLADAARAAIAPHFRQQLVIDDKGRSLYSDYDPVTIADRQAEEAMRVLIREAYPSHGILGEENGHEKGTCDLTWVLDPIDGTRAFITGVPLWGTLIALSNRSGPLLGVVDQPFLRERFTGSRLGSRYVFADESGDLCTRPCAELGDAVLYCTHPDMFAAEPEHSIFEDLRGRVRMSRFSGDCYSYCMLAFGLVDLVIDAELKPWDIHALIPIIEAAGGVVSDWTGGPAVDGGKVIAAGDSRTHQAALELLSKAAARG
ncbi:MAG: histidinol-phosphatase [Deltaproteobacteria bacterium]|nr:histidinol-phosphatase [Deltaproteobacteria bacterium]